MHPLDAHDLARRIETVRPGYWTNVVDGLLYMTCIDCGIAHSILIRGGPTVHEVRTDFEPVLTEATRENDAIELPVYRELIALRETVVQYKRALEEVDKKAEAALCYFDATTKQVFLKEIRKAVEAVGVQGGLTKPDNV